MQLQDKENISSDKLRISHRLQGDHVPKHLSRGYQVSSSNPTPDRTSLAKVVTNHTARKRERERERERERSNH